MIARLRAAGDERTAAILDTILEEEVAHVAAGSRWFRFACAARGLDPAPTFRETVERYWTGRIPEPTNVAHRRRAGFEDAELASWNPARDVEAKPTECVGPTAPRTRSA
jgi:uncharacterized ferritin-like protein (DUF455 family)